MACLTPKVGAPIPSSPVQKYGREKPVDILGINASYSDHSSRNDAAAIGPHSLRVCATTEQILMAGEETRSG